MSTSAIGRLLSAGVALAGLTSATLALAETRPPAPPPTPAGHGAAPPKGVKWEGPDFDAAKTRTPAKGKGWFVPDMDSDQSGMARGKPSPKSGR